MPSQTDITKLFGETGTGVCPGLAQTFDRRYINGTLLPVSGTMYISGIWLPAGMTVTNIVMYTGGTGVTTNTNNWAALYAQDRSATTGKLLAQSTTDAGGTDYAANTKFTKALTAAQVTTYSGLHYIAWMQAATTPALIAACAAPASSLANTDSPIVSASADTGLTTTAPAVIGALTATVGTFYAYVT